MQDTPGIAKRTIQHIQMQLTNDWRCVLSLGIKLLTSQKTCGRPAGDKDSKKHKIYRTVSIYRRAIAWIEGSGLVTPQNLVCCAILPQIKQSG